MVLMGIWVSAYAFYVKMIFIDWSMNMAVMICSHFQNHCWKIDHFTSINYLHTHTYTHMSTTRFCSIVDQFANMHSSNRYYDQENTSLWNLYMITQAILLALQTHNSNKMSNRLPPCGHSACCTNFLCWNANFIKKISSMQWFSYYE